ncbi:Thiamine repressibleregulatory protein thi1 [Fusarium oxysporum f. sp. albedinis]|nr:Thiamine repressibleregulatory protein thi1 [Fusarium oxysporum f. sp. albedinis]
MRVGAHFSGHLPYTPQGHLLASYSMVFFLAHTQLRLGGVASKSVLLFISNAKVNPDPSDHHRLLAEEKSSQSDASTKPKVEHG